MGKLSQGIGPLNDADKLRSLIEECEKSYASLDSQNARQLMLDVNAAHQLTGELAATGADIRGEMSRLVTVDDRIIGRAGDVVRSLGGRQTYVELRKSIAPDSAFAIWGLDRELDAIRSRLFQRIGILIGVLVVILIAGYIARPVLFPPDPVGDAVAAATRSLGTNDLPGAISAIDSTLLKMPTNTDLLIWKGILLEKTGDLAGSMKSYNLGLSNATSDRDFYLGRAITFVRIGESYRVITDTNTVLAKYPDSAEAYYVRATGYEGIGKRIEAMADLEKSAELAQAAGNDALFAQARVRLGTMMQAGR
jgi:tetratricopeptide (TPR) repeat protein